MPLIEKIRMRKLRRAFDTPDKKGLYVRRLFSIIADRYDIITVILSFGLDRFWKRRLVDQASIKLKHKFPEIVCLQHGQSVQEKKLDRNFAIRALDLASGTGDITFELEARGATVVGLDITPRMVELACSKQIQSQANCTFLVGDMMALPFPNSSFDLVTTGYGLRNVPILESSLREIYRVLRPGGLFFSLDFNQPSNVLMRSVYFGYLTVVGSLLGAVLHFAPDTYRYIPISLRHYPGAIGVVSLMRKLKFIDVGYTLLLRGLMAINYGKKGEGNKLEI